jgi:uncharacterized protein YyaL (SSP411 family)
MVDRFSDPAGGFFDTPNQAEKLLYRPKDLQDNATPSGNALAAEALLKMSALSGVRRWRELAENALPLVAGLAGQYPTGFGRWLSAGAFGFSATRQIAIVGDLNSDVVQGFLREINQVFRPFTVVAASNLPLAPGAAELLADRPMLNGQPTVYVCEGFVCRQPITELKDLQQQLGN